MSNAQRQRDVPALIQTCERLINYTFDDKLLCAQALNGGGDTTILYDDAIIGLPKSDALAVMGDVQQAAILCKWWWDSDRPEVDWDGLRKALLDNVSMAALGRELGVDECILINPETVSDADGRLTTDKMVATAMEAVAGAVYLDGGESKLGDLMRWLKYDQHSLLV